MINFETIVNKWFSKLEKGYAVPPYSKNEIKVLKEILRKQNAIIQEARIMKWQYYKGSEFVVKDSPSGIPPELVKLGFESGTKIRQISDPGIPYKGDGRDVTYTFKPKKSDSNQLPEYTKQFEIIGPENHKSLGKIITLGTLSTESEMNDFDGIFNRSGGEASGGDWEAIIVVAYNKLKGTFSENSDAWKVAQKYWDGYSDTAMVIAKDLAQKIRSNKLEQIGASTAALSNTWKGSNKTPKTDILGNGENISLKKSGGSQLMSSKAEETLSTFESACEYMGERKPGGVTRLMDNVQEKLITLSEPGKVEDFVDPKTKEKKPNASDEIYNEIVKAWENSKELTKELTMFFEKNSEFKQFFCYEAATGNKKFSDRNAVANMLVEFDPGNKKIGQFLKITGPESLSGIASKTTFKVSFKSSSGKAGLVLRGEMKKMNERFKTKTLKQIIHEAVFKETHKTKLPLLTEGKNIELLNEWEILDKIKKSVGSKLSAVASFAKELFNTITNAIKNSFEKIKKYGKRMIDGILEFLGFEVDKVSVSGSGSFNIGSLLSAS
jgi:hypothetical protein